MRRLLTSFIALAAMLMTSVEVKAWDAVAFRSTLDGIWDANTTSGKIMEKVDDNHFYIDITTNGDVSFRFYVSNGGQWLIPNNGDGTIATHNTNVWGNSGNSSTNDCFKLVPGTYNSFRIHLYHDNVGGDGKHYWKIKAVPNGSGGGGTSDEAYYLISPRINGGQKCEYLKFYPSRNRTKDGYNGETDNRYWTLNFKYDDIKKIDPNAPNSFPYYIVDKDGNAVCRPYDQYYPLGFKSPHYKYCDTKQDNDVTSQGHVQYETYDDTKTNAGGSNAFLISTNYGKSFTLFLDMEGNRPLTMNINKSLTEDTDQKYYLIGNLFSEKADPGAAWSPTEAKMRMLMERHVYPDSVVYTATVKRPANGWTNVYMGICPYYLIKDGEFSDYDWQHIYRPQVDPVIKNNLGSLDGVAPHGGLAIPGSGNWKYDYSSLNPLIDDDVESFIFSMNITTATYRIDYVHDLYIIGDAVQSGEPVSEWSGGKAQVLEYDANLGYWSANVTMNNGGYFRFANDMKMSSSFGENEAAPLAPDNEQAGVVYDNLSEAETQYVNKVNYYSESSAAHNADMQQRDIQFWLPSGTYTIKFYAQAENNGTAVANDFARTYYVIEPKFTFHAPVDRNNENLKQFTHFKAFSCAHTMKKPEGVTMYTAAVKEGTEGKTVTLTELTSTNNLIPANTGVLLATKMPGATSAAQEIDFTTADNPWEAIPFDQMNDLVPHLIKGTVYSENETGGYNYIFGYRTLNTTPSGKVTLGFFKPTGSNLPANSAYLQSGFNVTTDAQGFAIFYDEDNTTTAIDAVESTATANDNAPYYSLQGVRYAGKPAAGIYIHNGKKVIIK